MRIVDPVALGELVRDRRTELSFSQSDLAERTGTTRQWVSRLESGRNDVSLGRLFAVLDALDLRLDIRDEGAASAPTMVAPNILDAVEQMQSWAETHGSRGDFAERAEHPASAARAAAERLRNGAAHA